MDEQYVVVCDDHSGDLSVFGPLSYAEACVNKHEAETRYGCHSDHYVVRLQSGK